MNFAWPHLLWLLVAPAALLAWEFMAKRRPDAAAHPKIIRAEAGMRSLTLAGPSFLPAPASPLGARRRLWLCAGLALAIVALARPQWGRIDEPVFNQSREIVIAVDLSRSMLTPDVTPSRLERAKLLIQSLLDRLAGERVGLLVFSGTAFLQSPLSADYEILREFLPSLSPDFLPVGGTNYGAMIDAAAGAFEGKTAADRFLIVLSDGGANDENWRDHLGKLKEKGIRVIGLGVGTAAGGFIPDGNGGFMKDDQGAVVLAKLESDTLRELANKTGGAYRDAGDWVDLPALLKSTVEAGHRGQFLEKHTLRYVERFQWALAPALLCLLMSLWREFPVQPRPRDVMLKGALPAASILVLLFASAFLAPLSARAETAEPPPDSSALLGRIVGRLSEQSHPNALDWAELGRQTVTWGQQLQSSHQAVLPGPVHDALAAVDAGSALDPKATDWPRLRSDLEALLNKHEDQKKNDKQQQNQQQKQPQKQDQQQKQQQNPQQQKQEGSPQQQKKPSQGSQAQNQEQKPSPAAQKPSESAFGNMKPEQQPPSGGMQRVGGTTERKARDPAKADPALAIPLQKLDQVRNQDSPAELYQMIENKEPRPIPAANSKNW